MASSTTKKAIIYRFDREPLYGYVNPLSFLQVDGVEVLYMDGNAGLIPYPAIKTIAFVRDFVPSTQADRRAFQTRPKTEGLWVRLLFRDEDSMEGIMPNNLLQVGHYGFTVVPPDSSGNQQRIFAPREALRTVEVLGVVGSPLNRGKSKPAAKEQISLFDEA